MKVVLCSTALCALLASTGCDVHRTDPVPEVGAVVGDPEGARARPSEVQPRSRQSRVDALPGGVRDPEGGQAPAPAARDSMRSDSTPALKAAAGVSKPHADGTLASEVESALKAEPALRGASIDVRSEDGVVTLIGATSDPQVRTMAALVARSVQGVKRVRNELALAEEA